MERPRQSTCYCIEEYGCILEQYRTGKEVYLHGKWLLDPLILGISILMMKEEFSVFEDGSLY